MSEDVGVAGGNITTGGTLVISDADAGESAFVAQASTAGAYGSFTLAANGAWSYTASNSSAAIQALGAGDTLTETFTVTSVDGSTSTVVVTINGSNDAAVSDSRITIKMFGNGYSGFDVMLVLVVVPFHF